jgi:hypothetical protein
MLVLLSIAAVVCIVMLVLRSDERGERSDGAGASSILELGGHEAPAAVLGEALRAQAAVESGAVQRTSNKEEATTQLRRIAGRVLDE